MIHMIGEVLGLHEPQFSPHEAIQDLVSEMTTAFTESLRVPARESSRLGVISVAIGTQAWSLFFV